MPFPLCRHIMPTGAHCQSPAIKNARFCYHHGRQRRLAARPRRYGSVTIPFEFPEDRAAIQTNYHLAQLAILEGKLEPRQANAIINANRAAAVNLKAGPLTDPRLKNRVDRVILTPDEEEIAPAREACAPGEVLTHGPECPCGYCAETYRDAPGELHHPSCSCGFCHDTEESANESQPSHNSPSLTHHAGSEGNATPNPPTKEDAILSEVGRETANKVEEPAAAFDRPSERSEEPALPIPTLQATAADPAKAAKSFAAPSYIEPPPAESETNDKEDEQEPAPSYQSVIREYYAQLAERQAARATGDPAPRQGAFARWGGDGSSSTGHVARMPGRLALSNAKGRPVPEGIRRYNQLMAQIERNKQLAEEAWQRFVAAEQAAGRTVADPLANRAVLVTNPDGTTSKRYLTWNEEEDRRLAHRQRLREEEQSRKPA